MIDPELLRHLQTDRGRRALAEAEELSPKEVDFLSVAQRLSREFPEPLARAAVEQVILRRRAAAKFSRAGEMVFERQALEQASTELVSRYRAGRMAEFSLLFDLGCGFGGDSLALAETASVVAVDRDRLRLLLLAANARALGVEGRIHPLQADLTEAAWHFPPRTAAFFDPARRKAGRRVHSVEQYDPPLDLAYRWLDHLDALAVKVSPAVDLRQIRGSACEVEFISERGELKEACLWYGSLRTADRRATVLPGPHSLTASVPREALISPPRKYLHEPDPAVMRAGLVGELGIRIGASQIDPSIAYLTSDIPFSTPFAHSYLVLEVMPANLQKIRAALRLRGVGKLTVKKRGSAVDVESYVRRLRLRGTGQATLILTRAGGRKVAFLVEPAGEVDRASDEVVRPHRPG